MPHGKLILFIVFLAATAALPAVAAPRKARPAPAKPPSKRVPVKLPTAPKTEPEPPAEPPPPPGPAVVSLDVQPQSITLQGLAARRLLVVTGTFADGSMRDVSAEAKYVCDDPAKATVTAEGLVRPVKDGDTEVRVTLSAKTERIAVTVRETEFEAPISFTREIVPILTQAGCNSLACHGSPIGKNGFKLGMYGADPAQDFSAIARQERPVEAKEKLRVDLEAPENSLLLRKPTLQVPHGGGMRFARDSPEYRTLLTWLKAGAPTDTVDAIVTVTRLETIPAERVLEAGQRARVALIAHYSDGTSEDVSHRAVFSTIDDSIASAGESDGAPEVEAKASGETVLLARYLGRVAALPVLVPQPEKVSAADYAGFRPANFIDELALAKWKKLRVVPSDLCTDAEFLRRVSLDLTGSLPTPPEVRGFLASQFPDKRARKVDELLARPEYAAWWTLFWGDQLRNNSRLLTLPGATAYWVWIHESVANNKPFNYFARDLILARGGTFTTGPANFYRVAIQPSDRAEQVAQVFLGVRLQCANCHNHPFERWTRMDYHRLAAFFARVKNERASFGEAMVTLQPKGDYRHPETREVLEPAVLADSSPELRPDRDPRDTLAEWLTGPGNPLFARNLANRVWGHLFGRGIIDPVDDVRATNPPVNEELLAALARFAVKSRYDVKELIRTITNSRTYQLSSRANPRNARDSQNFSRSYHRRLKAEALLDAVCQATGRGESFPQYPEGTRAIELIDSRPPSYFMDIFGRPRREMVCTCEREEKANITQALHLINGATVNQKIAAPTGRLASLLNSGKADDAILEELYLWTLSRPPTSEEKQRALAAIAGAKPRQEAFEDRFWVLLNSKEFLFNH